MARCARAIPILIVVSFVPLVSFVCPLAAEQIPIFRAGVDLATLGVTVTDRRGNLVTDLQASDFEMYEDGKKQSVTFFAAGAPGDDRASPPMHLGLLMDVSESMGDDMPFTKTAMVKFLNMLKDAVDITVMDFDTEVRAARYSQNEFARLIERIRSKKAAGDTSIYDAIALYLDGASQQEGRKVMLLYTDGGDTRSSLALHELMELLRASDATVYVIGELEHESSSARARQQMTLRLIADATAGQAFFPTSVKQLDEVYAKVLAEIRAQYTVGYLSTNAKPDGTWRKVEVKVVRKDGRDLRIRARKGYFAARRP